MAPKQKDSNNSLETEKIVTTNSKKLELLYQGYAYDVTSFIHRHPGGKIIEMYLKTKEDAFNAVQQFHFRSIDKVLKIMKTLPKRPAMTKNDPAVRVMTAEQKQRYEALDKDFWYLFNQCKKEGLFETNRMHIFLRLLEPLLLFCIVTWLFFHLPGFGLSKVPYNMCLVLIYTISGIMAGRFGFLVHETGHNSLTGNTNIDNLIAKVIMGFFLGLSASWWKSQHNRHHAMPNNIKYDVDMKTLPLIAFNKKVVRNPRKIQNYFLVLYQKYLFATIDILLVGIHFKIQSISRAMKKLELFELLWMFAHYYLIIKIAGIWGTIFAYYTGGCYFLINFTLNHTHLPVTTEPVHWVEYSLSHTANIRSGLFGWVDYWMGYLNYQIEHHLMPAMPQYKNWLVRDRVKALAKKHNLQYNLISYTDAMKMTFANLSNVSNELREAQ